MVPVSVVIITKNEAHIIARCIQKATLITDDIVIIDNGSTDDTSDIANMYDCRVFKKNWDGYGANKNKGIAEAKYNWILSIDADEVPDDDLIAAIHQLKFNNSVVVYDIKFKSYFGEKQIHFGSWGRDHHTRLFDRRLVKWSETMVHEKLMIPLHTKIKRLNGHIHHYSVKNVNEYESKGCYYAKLSAKKYFNNGKKASFTKLYLSPLFGFLKNYIVYLGFLDGREGWEIAKTTVKNTYRKYHYLSKLEAVQHSKPAIKDSYVVEY
jgi:glycosyltransferase involved in cell wall biosynthesis